MNGYCGIVLMENGLTHDHPTQGDHLIEDKSLGTDQLAKVIVDREL